MSGAHTPGPWTRWRGDIIRAPILHREGCSQVVARTDTPWLKQNDGESDEALYTRGLCEQGANAALIAAAPELLVALEKCDDAFAGWQVGGIPGRPEDILRLITEVRVVLAKARGES